MAVEALSRPPFLGSTNGSVSAVNAGAVVMIGCLMAFPFSPWGRAWRTFWKGRGVTKRR